MKKLTLIALTMAGIFASCTQQPENPFFTEWNTPYGVPPFDQIKAEHFKPAFEEAMKRHNAEIDAIVTSADEPTFANTIVAYSNAGLDVERVALVFFGLVGSERTDSLSKIEEEMAPLLAAHSDRILMNDRLFARIKAVYDQKGTLGLQGEDVMLLENTYKNFVRGGANLDAAGKEQLQKINEEMAVLQAQYANNVLNDNNAFRLVVDKKDDLAGLPEGVITAAANLATSEGHDGKWAFTLDKPSWIPFLTYAGNRALRQRMFEGYANKGYNNNANDNQQIAARQASLAYQKAKLFGFATAAAYKLDDRMAKTPEAVNAFLHSLWTPAQAVTASEAKELQAVIDAENGGFRLAPWDWWYYAEKVKQQKYRFNEEEMSEYLQLDNVVKGCFAVTNKLWGLTFEEITDVPKFNAEAKAYLVKDADGAELAIFYADYHPRASKGQGAWMTNYREQSGFPNNNVMPVVINICNFTRPTADKPALLSIDEAETLFHEFGHALHGMISKCNYRILAGTNVKRDFVELPSQIMENWAMHPEVLKMYATHWKTGETIPDALIQKMVAARKFNQGFATTEYLAAAFLDMAWYSLTTDVLQNTPEFEKAAMAAINLPGEIIPRYRSTYYTHIFSNDYSAGYYSYIWAEVLDADAFRAFVETGNIFDPATALSFRKNILEKGGSEDPMTLYTRFRGKAPNVDALLINRGLK